MLCREAAVFSSSCVLFTRHALFIFFFVVVAVKFVCLFLPPATTSSPVALPRTLFSHFAKQKLLQ